MLEGINYPFVSGKTSDELQSYLTFRNSKVTRSAS